MVASSFTEGTELGDGRYVLEHRLGSGGMATVWLARDTRLQRRVAVKVTSDALSANETYRLRFQREARTAAAVSHPNLVPVFDYGCEGERPYLVSEFIDGDSLSRLRDRGEGPPTEPLARALLAALDHIHSVGIVHRDVKPANVLVARRGRIMLTDFGIAQSEDATALTATGQVIGTQSYIAPEVRRGQRATPRADLFSCGVVLREGMSDDDPPHLHRLVDRLTQLDPGERPASAAEGLEMLARADAEVTATVPAEPPTAPLAAEPPPPPPAPFPRLPVPPSRPRAPERVLDRREPRIPAAEPPARSGDSPKRSLPLFLGLLAAGAIAAVIAVLVLSGGDGGSDRPDGGRTAKASATGEKGSRKSDARSPVAEGTEGTDATATEATTAPVEPVTAASAPDPELATQLNDEGYALLQEGNVEEALPKLQQAVSLFPSDSTDVNYAYALYNYAHALRLSGQPEAAIPLLEKRLSFSDEQRETVEAELAQARAEAGEG